MNAQNRKYPIKKLVTLLGVASAGVFISFPALALINFNSSSFDGTLNNRTRRVESTIPLHQVIEVAIPLHQVIEVAIPLHRVIKVAIPLHRVIKVAIPLHRVIRATVS